MIYTRVISEVIHNVVTPQTGWCNPNEILDSCSGGFEEAIHGLKNFHNVCRELTSVRNGLCRCFKYYDA